MKIKAAIFDMDGTLVDSLGLWDVLWQAFGDRFCGGVKFVPDAESERKVRTMALREGMYLLHENCGLGKNGEAVFRTADEVFRNFYANSVTLKEGVWEYLNYCRDNGIRTVIASATAPELIEIALKHCGVRDYFEEIFSCSVVGKGKESPDIFLHTLDWLGTSLEETWVFEDSYVALETAQRAGFPTVGVYDLYNPWQDKVRQASTVYLDRGESMMKLAQP